MTKSMVLKIVIITMVAMVMYENGYSGSNNSIGSVDSDDDLRDDSFVRTDDIC